MTKTLPDPNNASSQVELPPWESPQWREAVRQNPGLAPFFDNFQAFVELPKGIEKLREMILDLAVRGNLVEQCDADEPASEMLARIAAERERREKAKELRKKKYPPPPVYDELPRILPKGWAWTRLSIIGEIGPRNDVADDLEVSFLPMKTIADGFAGSIEPEVRPWGEIKKGFTHVADGDIALAKITPCFQNRKSAVIRDLLNGVGAGTTELHVVRPIGNSIVPEYALLHLKCLTFLNVGVSKMTGSAGQKRVPKDYFSDTPFPLPPLAEQRRIVSKVEGLMSLCDTLESHRLARMSVRERARRSVLVRLTSASAPATTPSHKKPAQASPETLQSSWQRLSDHFEVLLDQPSGVDELRQSILQLAVQGKLVPQNPSDEPASELLARAADERREIWERCELAKFRSAKKEPKKGWKNKYKPAGAFERAPLYQIPEMWEWISFNQILAQFQYGPRFAKGEYVDDGIPTLRTSDMNFKGQVKLDDAPKVRIPQTTEDHWCLWPDDLIVTRTGATIGKCALYKASWGKAIASAYLIRFRFTRETVYPDFVLLYLMSPVGLELLISGATEMAQPNVNATNISEFPTPIPPLAEQKRIVSKVSVLLSQLDELSTEMRSRQSTTDALLTALIHQILKGTNGDGQ